MSIQNAYDQWSKTYDTDENFTRDLDGVITKNTLENLRCNTILEIGCGTGKNTNLLAQIAKKVYAIDFSQRMIIKAKSKVKETNVIFFVADITKRWPSKNESIDLIVCNLVLEHIEDLAFVFSEVARSLVECGKFFISELHPFKQYQGKKATFQKDGVTTEIPAFVHHISDFLGAATGNGMILIELKEWWHEKDQTMLPRLVSFMFEKSTSL